MEEHQKNKIRKRKRKKEELLEKLKENTEKMKLLKTV